MKIVDDIIHINVHNRSIEEKFWEKVNKESDDKCWTWTASINNFRYGNFNFNGIIERSHRVSWILTNGKIPEGLCVLHKCDNRKCVNPNHLFLGTYKDNAIDRNNKKRGYIPDPEHVNTTKLTWNIVREIRKEYKENNITYRNLAKKYGISRSEIGYIIKNEHWKE